MPPTHSPSASERQSFHGCYKPIIASEIAKRRRRLAPSPVPSSQSESGLAFGRQKVTCDARNNHRECLPNLLLLNGESLVPSQSLIKKIKDTGLRDSRRGDGPLTFDLNIISDAAARAAVSLPASEAHPSIAMTRGATRREETTADGAL